MAFNIFLIIGVILVVEGINLLLRFGIGMTSRESHRGIMKSLGFKWIPHFHHLYWAVPAGIFYYFNLYLLGDIVLGFALSDLLHHIILKIFTGDSEFDIFYKM
jgi:hypothetical protein